MSIHESTPLYVTIPAFGNEWTVTYAPTENYSSIIRSGYGDMPEDCKHLPCVDFQTCNDFSIVGAFYIKEAYGRTEYSLSNYIPMKEAFRRYKEAGCTITNFDLE